MNRKIVIGITLLLVCAGPVIAGAPSKTGSKSGVKTAAEPAAADSAKRHASRDGWPDTRTGAVAAGWVEAFSGGESAMRVFLAANLTEEALARKSMSQRMETYRSSHGRFGRLMLVSVDKHAPGEITAMLMASDATEHKFVFKVMTEAPYKLVSVSLYELQHSGGHGGFGH